MADEEMADVATPTSGTTSDGDVSDDDAVELLVKGRERRKTAGNRYDRQMVQEEGEEADEEDEVALLFAGEQDEVDEEFKSEASDEDDMSSSDDDDQGPNAGADDMEGEKDIEKQAKEERAQKRKAKDALTSTAALRKRPKIDPTASKTTPKKPSKKKERVTWLPDLSNAGGRNSLRKQTIAHRATTIARLKESEAQSKINKAIREERDKEKARDAPEAMTQADRLAEAERTERRNAKSLNRWEAMEKKRNDEQAAKLAALKDRKLEGPVVSWRSIKEHYRGPKHTPRIGFVIEEGPKKRGRKTNAYHEQMARTREEMTHNTANTIHPIGITQQHEQTPSVEAGPRLTPGVQLGSDPAHSVQTPKTVMPGPTTTITSPPPPPPPLTPPPQSGPIQPQTIEQTQIHPESNQTGHSTPLPATQRANNSSDSKNTPPHTPATQLDVPKGGSFLHGIFDYANMEGDEESNVESQPLHGSEIGGKAAIVASDTTSVDAKTTVMELVPPSPIEASASDARKTQAVSEIVQPPSTAVATASEPDSLPVSVQTLQSTQEEHAVSNPIAGPQSRTSAAPAQDPTPLIQAMQDLPASTTEPSPLNAVAHNATSPKIAMEEGWMTKNLITLKGFDELSASQKHKYGVFFNTRKSAKPVRHNMTLCPITLLPARYRDPATGIGYANMHAYRVLQELKAHKFAWSSMLGCYVGREGAAISRGCPEGFLPAKETTIAELR